MDWNFVIAAAIVGEIGLLIGLFLCLAEMRFKVEADPRETAIAEALPGANCGGCGFSGCAALAAAIVKGDAEIDACPVGGQAVVEQISEIMGVSIPEGADKMVCFVRCVGTCEKTTEKYNYSGPQICGVVRSAPGGGPKSCAYGCSGFGDCVQACEFGALSIVKGVAVIDPEKCLDCGACISACPKGLIIEIPYKAASRPACVNPEKGKAAMASCGSSCIVCKKCEKDCTEEAIKLDKGYPEIDYRKCTNCGKCKESCPRKCIV